MSAAALSDWLAETREWADAAIERHLTALDPMPERLLEALRYALFGGGKRVRPALVRMACRTVGGDDAAASAPAAAVEMIHTYSLVHDDLPCMDDDDLRRGRPTCHKVYGDAIAVLVGDGLQAAAFEVVAGVGTPHAGELARVLARGAGCAGMVGGQLEDLEATGGVADPDVVRRVHRMKTAALIGASVELGAVAGGATPEVRAALSRYGEALGLCFQAVDDVLDVTGDEATLGKTPGKDAADDKATLVAALGLAGARAEAVRLADAARGFAREAGCAEGDLAFGMVEAVLNRTS